MLVEVEHARLDHAYHAERHHQLRHRGDAHRIIGRQPATRRAVGESGSVRSITPSASDLAQI
jgi:hypothetical protein